MIIYSTKEIENNNIRLDIGNLKIDTEDLHFIKDNYCFITIIHRNNYNKDTGLNKKILNGPISKKRNKFHFINNNDSTTDIEFGYLVIKKEDLELFTSKRTRIRAECKHRDISRLIMNPQTKDQEVDHINRNRLDNRKINLRLCNRRQNMCNKEKLEFKGICWHNHNKKWFSRISYNNKAFNLGFFNDKIEAARIYDTFARYLNGDFAILNFPELQSLDIDVKKFINQLENRRYTSKYIGVHFIKRANRYIAQIKDKYIGCYKTEKDAAIAYNKEAEKLGYKLNIIEE